MCYPAWQQLITEDTRHLLHYVIWRVNVVLLPKRCVEYVLEGQSRVEVMIEEMQVRGEVQVKVTL